MVPVIYPPFQNCSTILHEGPRNRLQIRHKIYLKCFSFLRSSGRYGRFYGVTARPNCAVTDIQGILAFLYVCLIGIGCCNFRLPGVGHHQNQEGPPAPHVGPREYRRYTTLLICLELINYQNENILSIPNNANFQHFLSMNN